VHASPAGTPSMTSSIPAPPPIRKNSSAIQGWRRGNAAQIHRGGQGLIKYLGSAEAGEIGAPRGLRFAQQVGASQQLPDPVTQADASELQHATSFVFSLDDLQGSWEPSLWQDMLNFVKNPPRRTSHRSRRPCRLRPRCTGSLGSCDSNEPPGTPGIRACPGASPDGRQWMAVVAVDRQTRSRRAKRMPWAAPPSVLAFLVPGAICSWNSCLADIATVRYSFYNGTATKRSGSPTTSRCSRPPTP